MATAPKRGDLVTVRGHEYRVIKVYPFGTMDVEHVATGACLRITGLQWVKA